ncbi:MAG: iron-containing redox enzyme family protein [Scytonema sp. PMC 1069.18]|nr:iron-containing redox enzyme family protein [Scytonema sp. PMC 1069.18]MEC4881468.1 iron-containing redox enzyme family protein [Scytonema sp. PMC 1070.18]
MSPISKIQRKSTQIEETINTKYKRVEQQFIDLLATENLDKKLNAEPALKQEFESTLSQAICAAYQNDASDDAAHLFVQRILYRINRLNLFWYDDLQNYVNERSPYLYKVRDQIEKAWQEWERSHIDVTALQQLNITDVQQSLKERTAYDLNPPLSENSQYIRTEMSEAGYRQLLAIGSFEGLVESSHLPRILGGAANTVQCALMRVFQEEYGYGRLSRKHSTFFAQMLNEFGMNTKPEAYFDFIPWELFACSNHSYLISERKRYFLRYNGGLTYFEISVPATFRNYVAAAQRLGLSNAAMSYWEVHIKEDERHGRWMLDGVALPLAEMYPNHAWELLLGYDQEKFMGDRAAQAVVGSIREAEQQLMANG